MAGRGTGRVRGQAGHVGLLVDVVGTGSAALAALRDAAARTRGVLSLAFDCVPFVRATPSLVTNRLRYYDKASVPLLVDKTEVVAMQGAALFKLRITSLRAIATNSASASASRDRYELAAARAGPLTLW